MMSKMESDQHETAGSMVKIGWPFPLRTGDTLQNTRRHRRFHRSGKLASRKPRDARELLHVDKLDKYLDLAPLLNCTYGLAGLDSWDDVTKVTWKQLINEDTREMLRLDDIQPYDLISYRVDPTLPSKLLLNYLTNTGTKSHMGQHAFRESFNVMSEASRSAVYQQVKHLISHMSPTLHNLNEEVIQQWMKNCEVMPGIIIRMLAVSEDWMKILESNRQLMKYINNKNTVERVKERLDDVQHKQHCPSFGGDFSLYPTMTLLTLGRVKYIMNHDLLLECHNKACELTCALIYSWQLSITVLPQTHLEDVMEYLKHLARVVARYGAEKMNPRNMEYFNRGFVYLKSIEALGVATIIAREDATKGWVNKDLSEALWKSLSDANLVHASTFSDSDLKIIFDKMSVAQIAEVLGLVKLCGHPSIEVSHGLDKLYERTHNHIEVNEVAVARSIGVLTRDLTKNFFRRHNKFPIFDNVNGVIPRQLEILMNSHIGLFATTRGRGLWSSITLDQWSQVRFGKNGEFDMIDNRLPLLKDKAIGLTRTKAYKLLLANLDHDSAQKQEGREKRRVLLQYLLSPHMDSETTEYLHSYCDDPDWSAALLEYMVIKLTPKELEEKVEGRMFGASPLPERNRRIIQEYNVMKLMDSYIDDQIMTPDELSMIRKLYSFRCFNAMYPNHSLLQVSFDFSRWNNNMRSASIDVPGAVLLDRWYGTRMYGKTMKFYQNALVYYNDGDQRRHWEGQEGGIEGLNQATWSLVFIGGIKQALEELGLSYQLTVKGDDVRAAIAIENTLLRAQGPKVYRDWVLNQLLELCQQMGWQLNPQECFVSLSVIATSKQYQVNDTWLPASTKKMMKTLSLTNVVFPTVEDIVAGAYSTAHSAANQSPVLLPAYFSATLIASRELLRRFDDVKMSPEMLAVLLMWPQCLGGPGALPLQTFFVRGENDMLSVSVSLLRHLYLNGPQELKCLVESIISQVFSEDRDARLLLMDPYSISLDIPERPQARLKKLVRKAIKKYTKNEDILQLLTLDTEEDEKAWVDHLLSMTPYHAKVATVLWENSPFYLIEEVLSKFMQSVTIFDFLCYKGTDSMDRRQGYKSLSSIIDCEKLRYQHWKRVILNNYATSDVYLGVSSNTWDDLTICTTELVHKIRQACWNREIIGLTYPSLVDQNILTTPEDAAHLAPNWNMGQIANTIHIDLGSSVFQTTDRSIHYASQPDNPPWLGSVTSGKAKLPGLATRVHSPTISKIMKLLYLKSAGSDLGPEFQSTVITALRALTTIDMSNLQVLDPEISGGHIPHRTAMNSYSMTTMPNSRPNLLQLVRMDETCPAVLRGDLSNRTINYAARYFYSIFASLLPLQVCQNLPASYPKMVQVIFHEDQRNGPEYHVCPFCCNVVDGTPPIFRNKCKPTLAKYCTVALVGSSEHDKKILLSAIKDAIQGRARKFASEIYGDADNPLIQYVATQVVLSQFGKDAQKVYEAALGSGYLRVPQGKTLEALSVSLGVRALSRVSINLLRCAQPDYLYSYLLSVTIQWFIGTVGVDIDSCPVERALQTQSHLSPLAGLLSQMTTAGVMNRISIGASMLQGEQFILRWGPQDLRDSSSAVQTFIKHHEELLLNLCENPMMVNRLKLFLECEDHETINDKINSWRSGVQNFVLSRLIEYTMKNNMFKVFDWPKCQRALHIERNEAEWTDHDIRRIIAWFIDQVSSDTPVTQFFGWIYAILQIQILLIPIINECEVDEAMYNYCEDVMLYREDGEGEGEEIEWSPGYCANHEGGIRLSKIWSEKRLNVIFNVTVEVLNNVSLNNPLTGLQEAKIFVIRALSPLNHLTLLCMTLEDAERVMKSRDYSIADAAKMIQETADREENTDHDQILDRPLCRIERDIAHREEIRAGSLVNLGSFIEEERTHPVLMHGLSTEERQFKHHYAIDPHDLGRCIGSNNTSVAKFAEVVYSSGLIDHQHENRVPSTIVCTADGLGGVTALMLRLFPYSDVIYNSLYMQTSTGCETGDANVYNPPTEVLALPPSVQWTNRLHYKGLYPGDLNEVGVRENIMNLVRFTRKRVSIFTCDAEIPRYDRLAKGKLLWSNVVDMIQRLSNEHLHVIIKLFTLNSTVMFRVLNCLCFMFRHFHIIRCEATRSHSVEFLFYGTEMRALLPRDLPVYVRGETRYSERAGVNTYLSTRYQQMAVVFRATREHGYTITPNLRYLFRRFLYLNIPPTPISCHNGAIGIKITLTPDHVCGSIDQIQNNMTYKLEQIKSLLHNMNETYVEKIQRGRQVRHNFQVFGQKGDVLAQGPPAMIRFIKGLWRVEASHAIWTKYKSEPNDLTKLCDKEMFLKQVESCLKSITHLQMFSMCRIEFQEGEIFLQLGDINESITLLLRSYTQKVLQMVGSSLYAHYILLQDRQDKEELLYEHMPGSVIRDCCVLKAQQLMNSVGNLTRAHDLFRSGIMLTLDEWYTVMANTGAVTSDPDHMDNIRQTRRDIDAQLTRELLGDMTIDTDWATITD